MIKACRNNNLEEVKKYSIINTSYDSDKALRISIMNNFHEITKELIKNRINSSSYFNTLDFINDIKISEDQNLKIVEELLNEKIQLGYLISNYLLSSACKFNYTTIAELLIKNYNVYLYSNCNSLTHLCYNGQLKIFYLLFNVYTNMYRLLDFLQFSIKYGQTHMVTSILKDTRLPTLTIKGIGKYYSKILLKNKETNLSKIMFSYLFKEYLFESLHLSRNKQFPDEIEKEIISY